MRGLRSYAQESSTKSGMWKESDNPYILSLLVESVDLQQQGTGGSHRIRELVTKQVATDSATSELLRVVAYSTSGLHFSTPPTLRDAR